MKKAFRYLAILSLFLIIIFICFFKIVDFDFGFHLKTGEYIFYERTIPRNDIFSYIAKGNKWVDSHWLFQLVLYIVYLMGGTAGVILMRILVIALTFAFLFLTVYRKEYFSMSILVCLFALFVSFQRFLIRPEIFSLLFLAAFYYLTERFSSHPRLSLIAIPVLQIIWVNMHGLHVLGIGFLTLYLLGDILQALISKYSSIVPKLEIKAREWKEKGILFFIAVIALLINANGKDGILYPYRLFNELKARPTVFSRITELISPFAMKHLPFPDPSVIYKIFIIVSILALICNLKHIRLAHLFPYGAFLYLSVLSVRNIPLFALIATPMTIRNLYGISDFILKHIKIKPMFSNYLSYALSICFIAFAIFLCIFIGQNRLYKRLNYLRAFGLGESDFFPFDEVTYIKDKDFTGNIFNSSDIGGYLIWKLYPEKLVALDGRWEVYGDFLENIKQLSNPYYFSKLVEKYDIVAIILYKRSWEIQLMGPWLQRNPFWRLTKKTWNSLVYEKVY
ncbi:hypothetical protein JXL19_01380 [bacterium]|nr:hypothetical protein [bacterium]